MGLLAKWLGQEAAGAAQDALLAADITERLLDLNPQLRLVKGHAQRLGPAIGTALGYVNGIIAAVPPPREASAAAWAHDPYIHAFFTAPEDIARSLSRSADLRAFFDQHPDAQQAFAVLGMALTEKHILGVALEGETMRRDVVQLTVSFSDHQVRVCGRTDQELRRDLVRRLVDQLGLDALSRIAAGKSRRELLEEEKALLKVRVTMLERQGVGLRAVMGHEAGPGADELAQLRERLAENARNLGALGIRSEALERELGQLCAVLQAPAAYIFTETRQYRLDRMNVALDPGSSAAGPELAVQLARIPTTPPQLRAFALVRFARADLLPAVSMFDEAARLLA
jgi:hypothetical protein